MTHLTDQVISGLGSPTAWQGSSTVLFHGASWILEKLATRAATGSEKNILIRYHTNIHVRNELKRIYTWGNFQ